MDCLIVSKRAIGDRAVSDCQQRRSRSFRVRDACSIRIAPLDYETIQYEGQIVTDGDDDVVVVLSLSVAIGLVVAQEVAGQNGGSARVESGSSASTLRCSRTRLVGTPAR